MGRVLDLVVGLSFAFILLASIVTALTELVAWLLSRRASTLREGITTLLGEPLRDQLYGHSLVRNLSAAKGPSYIPTPIFVSALVDEISRQAPSGAKDVLTALRQGIAHLPDQPRQALTTLVDQGVKSVDEAKAALGQWFDASMDRVSGVYKRKSTAIALWLALGVTVALNADAVRMSEALWLDPAVRAEMVRQASAAVLVKRDQGPTTAGSSAESATTTAEMREVTPPAAPVVAIGDSLAELNRLTSQVDGLGLPLGWADWSSPRTVWGVLRWILGLLATALAVSLGAPFWFEVLNRVANARAVGPKPEGK